MPLGRGHGTHLFVWANGILMHRLLQLWYAALMLVIANMVKCLAQHYGSCAGLYLCRSVSTSSSQDCSLF